MLLTPTTLMFQIAHATEIRKDCPADGEALAVSKRFSPVLSRAGTWTNACGGLLAELPNVLVVIQELVKPAVRVPQA